MITNIKTNPSDWKNDVYIAIKGEPDYDDEGNEIPIYSKPEPYSFNYQSVSSNADIAEFGERAKMMKKAVISIAYKDQFKEFDVAYLDGITPQEETIHGSKANYRLLPPRNGNAVIIIYFEKLVGK